MQKLRFSLMVMLSPALVPHTSHLVKLSLYCYHPQMKFAKVMFLHLSVSHSVHKGRGLPQCMLGYHPTPGKADHSGKETPRARQIPPAQCMLVDTVNKRAICILLECNSCLLVSSRSFC